MPILIRTWEEAERLESLPRNRHAVLEFDTARVAVRVISVLPKTTVCPICGDRFTPQRKDQKYCQERCTDIARHRRYRARRRWNQQSRKYELQTNSGGERSSEQTKPALRVKPASLSLSGKGDTDMGRRRNQRRGYLRKEGPSWLLSWWEDEVDDKGNRKRVRRSKAIGPARGPGRLTKPQAGRAAWEEVLSRLDQNVQNPMSSITFEQFVNSRFEPDIIARCRSEHYHQTLAWVLPAVGNKRLREITGADVQKLLTTARMQKKSWQWQKHLRATVTAVFRHAKRVGYFSGDLPTEFITLGTPVRRSRGALSPAQVWAIAEALGQPYRALVLVLACVGLRISEALGLKWKWLNLAPTVMQVSGEILAAKSVSIREAWVRQRWTVLKTSGSAATLPLPDVIVTELAQLKARAIWKGLNDPVFTVKGGRPFEPSTAARKKLKPVLRSLSLPEEVSWHWFRHTLASIADQEGMTVPQRQAVLRHTDAAMTARYTHTDMEQLRAGLNAVADRIVSHASRKVS